MEKKFVASSIHFPVILCPLFYTEPKPNSGSPNVI